MGPRIAALACLLSLALAGCGTGERADDAAAVAERFHALWEATLQNWQSEFLAVGSMAILAVYLRQRGSPESKPVGAPHTADRSGGLTR